jgi:mono/diheme cytochrome c family protein
MARELRRMSVQEKNQMKRILTLAGLTAVAVLMTAGLAVAQDAKKEEGLKLFSTKKCTTCHSIAGKGNKKGALDEVGSKLTAAQIKAWITDPVAAAAKAKPAPTRKPAMKKTPLSASEVDTLVALLTSLKKSVP